MNSLVKADQDAQRMHSNALFAVKQAAQANATISDVIGNTQHGQRQSFNANNAQEQYQHFTSWVFAAIRPIAQKIAGQTICVGRLNDRRVPGRKSHILKSMLPDCYKSMGDQIEPLDSHPLLDALASPNQLMVGWSLLYSSVASLELTGRAFWWSPDGSSFLPLPSHWVRGHEGTTSYERWIVQPPGIAQEKYIPAEEIVYFHYPHPQDPKASFSPLQAAAMAVTTDEALQDSQRLAFERGIMPKVVLKAGRLSDAGVGPGERPNLNPAQRSQLVNAIRTVYAGHSKWNEPLILDSLIEDVDTLGRSIAEMDFLQSGQQTKARVFQVFGTNPIIAGEIDGANRAQATVAEQQFCSGTVNPKIELMSQVMTRSLAPMFSSDGERLVVWIEKCKANDPEQRLKEWSLGLTRNAVTRNEYRAHILNLPKHPDGDSLLPPSPSPSASVSPDKSFDVDPYSAKGINGNANHRSSLILK